eukprot:Awhi_evm1s2210
MCQQSQYPTKKIEEISLMKTPPLSTTETIDYYIPSKAWPTYRTYEANRFQKLFGLQTYNLTTVLNLPLWRRDNDYIIDYYRVKESSIEAVIQSLLYLHNQTMNVYSHGLGALYFLYLWAHTMITFVENEAVEVVAIYYAYYDANNFSLLVTDEHTTFRGAMFVLMGVIGGGPILYYVFANGYLVSCQTLSMDMILIGVVYLLTGVFVWAFRLPEIFSPGTFDIFFQGHTIHHLTSITFCYHVYLAMVNAFHYSKIANNDIN